MSENLFGTDGIRGRFAEEPFTVTTLMYLGQAIAQWAIHKYGPECSILLAHDTRISSGALKAALESGLLLYPLHLHDTHIAPVSALASIMKQDPSFDCGIMISASHNPYYDNGIKIIDCSGKISSNDEKYISDIVNHRASTTDYTMLGNVHNAAIQQDYINRICSFFDNDFLWGKKIVLDCAHGATFQVAPALFSALGAQTITIFDKPNGLNINKQCGALYPQALQKAVLDYQADIGFAFDGDGDRVIAVNKYGALKNGDDILSMLTAHPCYANNQTIIGTIMSNQGFEEYLVQQNKKLVRAQIGDKYVAEKLIELDVFLGGEPSGHIILRDYLATGDGIFTALRLSEVASLTNNWEMTTFTKFPQIHSTIAITYKKDLTRPPFSDIIAAGKTKLHAGRLVIRYSGTEPVLRIMVEDDDGDHAQSICSLLSHQLQESLNKPEIL
jgi:phosphoglucosamine mutase